MIPHDPARHHLASEAHGPNELIDYASHAEAAGFDFAVVSDHYHAWVSQQNHSPFVWETIGGIARETDRLELGTSVTCPTIRIHPAIIAQAAATAQVLMDGRFFLGVGTGERLNEHILGDHWPPHRVRLEMLEEAVDVIRDLWEGEMTSHDGELIVRCRLPPRVAVATSVFVLAVAAIAGATVHALAATPVWYIVAWSIPGVLIGGTIGTRVGKYVPSEVMEPALGIVFAMVGAIGLASELLA